MKGKERQSHGILRGNWRAGFDVYSIENLRKGDHGKRKGNGVIVGILVLLLDRMGLKPARRKLRGPTLGIDVEHIF